MTFDLTALEPLDRAIIELVRTIPTRWEDYHINDLSSTQEKASRLLVGAGLVELRNTLRYLMAGDRRVLRVRFRATGEKGLSIVTEQVLQAAAFWHDNGKLKNQVRCEREHASQRRLTDQGELSRNDLEENRHHCLLEFVKKTGLFAYRPNFSGHGIIESLEIIDSNPDGPKATATAVAYASVGNITVQNHQDVHINTDSLAQVLASALEKLGQVPQPSKPTEPQEQAAVQMRAWTAEELNEAIRQYRAKRAATFNEFVSILDNPKATARQKRLAYKNARNLFGRNVIARELGVKSPKMVGDTPAWKSIAASLKLSKRFSDITIDSESVAKPGRLTYADSHGQALDSQEAILLDQEREQTLQCLRKFATSMRNGARKHAKTLLHAYEAGEMSDAQIRHTIEALSNETL